MSCMRAVDIVVPREGHDSGAAACRGQGSLVYPAYKASFSHLPLPVGAGTALRRVSLASTTTDDLPLQKYYWRKSRPEHAQHLLEHTLSGSVFEQLPRIGRQLRPTSDHVPSRLANYGPFLTKSVNNLDSSGQTCPSPFCLFRCLLSVSPPCSPAILFSSSAGPEVKGCGCPRVPLVLEFQVWSSGSLPLMFIERGPPRERGVRNDIKLLGSASDPLSIF